MRGKSDDLTIGGQFDKYDVNTDYQFNQKLVL